MLCKISSWDTLIYASHVFKFIFCSSKSITCYICLCNVWLVSFRNITEFWFWTDVIWIVYLCYLIHDYIQSQLVNLRVCACSFGWCGVSNGSLSLPLWWTWHSVYLLAGLWWLNEIWLQCYMLQDMWQFLHFALCFLWK